MEKSTLKSYNDLFKETDGNTAKFYVLYNTNLTYLLTANEIVTFYQIVHVCNINRNYASLNYLARLLNHSNKTVQKSITKLLQLNLISRERNYSGTYYYTLNLEVIADVYNKLNSCHTLEERDTFCKEYVKDCVEQNGTVSNSAMEKFTTPMEKNSTPMENFTTGMEKITTPPMEKFTTHISNMFIKKDEFHNKNEFNNENESHNKDVEVGETANAETLNETANANSSFNNNSNVGKESVSTDDVISKMFPELPIEDRKKQADANNSNGVADAGTSSNINLNKSSRNNLNKTSVSIKNKNLSNSSIEEGTLNREPKNSTDVDSNNVNNGTADTGISSNNDKIEEQANADSNDENKAFGSIENEKTTDCSNDRKSFNREPENDVIVDSNDVVTIDETALAKDYYQRVLYTESLEELESLSNEIKQLPIKESYIKELLQLIETTSEQFNENSEDASEFDLNESLNNNPIFARVYNTVLASLSKFNLGTLVAYKEQLQSDDLKELSQQEKIELQNLVENSIIKLQERYSNIA